MTKPLSISKPTHILRLLCRDSKGIIAWVSGHLAEYGGNIVDLEQHAEKDSGLFAMRLEVEGLKHITAFKKAFKQSFPFQEPTLWLDAIGVFPRVGILVTKEPGCLYELLIKQKTGELACEFPFIISNRRDLAPVAKDFGIPFVFCPVEEKHPKKQEESVLKHLRNAKVDCVVLARYMRILSAAAVRPWLGKMINIHHSFLPAFVGAKPYHQAWYRGVKLIGATAHYVTEDLDEGPIIHQAAVPVSHRHSIKAFVSAGADLERTVLVQALRAHLEHRIILTGRRTIVFH